MVSLVPTDTAIKGNVNLSNKATILIDKDRYETLSLEEKDKLAKLNLNVTIFQGNLKEAVNEALIRKGRYTAETLSLAREDDGYIKSDTSDEVRRTIRDVANERNIAQVLHWSVITGQNAELDKLENVKDDFENGCIVKDFYKRAFFASLHACYTGECSERNVNCYVFEVILSRTNNRKELSVSLSSFFGNGNFSFST